MTTVRTVVCALLAGDWWVTGGVLKIVRRIWEVAMAGLPVISRQRGTFSTLLQQSGFHWWRSGNIIRMQNVSEYMLVLALCLVCRFRHSPELSSAE